METFISPFSGIRLKDVPEVGGKNASLGEMLSTLGGRGIRVPDGFATTAQAFWYFLDSNPLREPLKQLMLQLDRTQYSNLHETGASSCPLIPIMA